MFFIGPNNDGNISLIGRGDDNDIALDNQKISIGQTRAQNKIVDDYSLRGAISNTSGGKQVLEKYQTHLCGASFEKGTDFIQEYTLPFTCSQPVGITVQQQQNSSNSGNNNTTANAQKI
jgi:hypothetical protein